MVHVMNRSTGGFVTGAWSNPSSGIPKQKHNNENWVVVSFFYF